ncbi:MULTISPECIES: HAD family hydrolase [unclassified Halomonas]|uniref:HAD family hydrolase n=1 Tax=unclassified Halomonas TaxID=2609666 RepID=UPI0009904141|nr:MULTISPECIES: HAD family phosphatase [unclassified Halomonas]AQU82636.1 hypothetical protein B2G49_08480 [Halomonas sp. 'Soap Lake \
MSVNAKVKAVVFDLDGVYFERGTENFVASLIHVYGLTPRQVEDVYFNSEEMKKLKLGEITSHEFWSFATQRWNVEATREELIEMMLSGYEVREETQKYIEKLRLLGVKVAACSNNFSDRIDGLTKKFNLDQRFDKIVVSCKIGLAKPHSKVFNYLASELDLMPHEIVMSDDKESNVTVLQELGFEAFLYEGWSGFVEKVDYLLFSDKNNG